MQTLRRGTSFGGLGGAHVKRACSVSMVLDLQLQVKMVMQILRNQGGWPTLVPPWNADIKIDGCKI